MSSSLDVKKQINFKKNLAMKFSLKKVEGGQTGTLALPRLRSKLQPKGTIILYCELG